MPNVHHGLCADRAKHKRDCVSMKKKMLNISAIKHTAMVSGTVNRNRPILCPLPRVTVDVCSRGVCGDLLSLQGSATSQWPGTKRAFPLKNGLEFNLC